jgi:hypothetical protein
VDPTSAIAPSRIEPDLLREIGQRGWLFDSLPAMENFEPNWMDFTRQWMDSVNTFWREWVIDFNQDNQWDLLSRLRLTQLPKQLFYSLVLLVIGLFIVFIARRLIKPYGKKDPITRVMQKWLDFLAKKGLEKSAGEGMLSFARRVAEAMPDQREQIDQVVSAYIELRFNKEPKGTVPLDTLDKKVTTFLKTAR